jgi:hypothetical protein
VPTLQKGRSHRNPFDSPGVLRGANVRIYLGFRLDEPRLDPHELIARDDEPSLSTPRGRVVT